jgi:hypothetical protein
MLFLGLLAALAGCTNDTATITVEAPDISSLQPDAAQYGDTIVVTGSGFGEDPSGNLIVISPGRFSDAAARRVITPFGGSRTELRGIVPDGSFAGSVRVEQTGAMGGAFSFVIRSSSAASNTLPFSARLLAGDVGKAFFSGSDYGFSINAGVSSEDYLVVLFSSAAAPDNTWTYLYDITAQSATSSAAQSSGPDSLSSVGADETRSTASKVEEKAADMGMRRRDFRKRADEEIVNLLRKSGGAADASRRSGTFRPAISGAGAPAATAQFQVLIDPGESVLDPDNFKTVEADLKFEGDHTLLYVDTETPVSCLSDGEAEDLGQLFDASIYGIDRSYFGEESDINGDSKVAILMSPTINEMTLAGTAGSHGFIAGYFLSNDLLPELLDAELTNGMEIFYAMVPDPTGLFGNTFPKAQTLSVIESVLSHEFLHMILFNYRILIYGHGYSADYMEDTWLNEGLAHIAEDLNGYTSSNIARANRYLADPGDVTLIYGGDELDERGASFLFLRHLGDRFGTGVFKSLVQSKKIGVENIEAATGQHFKELFADWSAACYLSGRGITDDPRFNYSSIDLQGDFDPIYTMTGNVSGSQMDGFVKAMAPEYIKFTIPASGSVEFTLESDASGRMNAAVIRLR